MALSVDPPTAFGLLHAGLRVIPVPTPIPDELWECPECFHGNDFGYALQAMDRQNPTLLRPCRRCRGTQRVSEIECLVHCTTETKNLPGDLYDGSGDVWQQGDIEIMRVPRYDQDGALIWSLTGVGIPNTDMPLGSFIAKATITSQHEITKDPHPHSAEFCCPLDEWGSIHKADQRWHLVVGSVEPINPTRYEPSDDLAGELLRSLQEARGTGVGPLWRVPEGIAEQVNV